MSGEDTEIDKESNGKQRNSIVVELRVEVRFFFIFLFGFFFVNFKLKSIIFSFF